MPSSRGADPCVIPAPKISESGRSAPAILLRYLSRDHQNAPEWNGQNKIRPTPGRFDSESDPQLELNPGRIAIRTTVRDSRLYEHRERSSISQICKIGFELARNTHYRLKTAAPLNPARDIIYCSVFKRLCLRRNSLMTA